MTHSDSMKEHLIAQFDKKPVLYAILDALGAELDEIEEATTRVKNCRYLDTSIGEQLDGLGKVVDEARRMSDGSDLDDTLYRKIIKAKILKDTSPGTPEDTITALKTIFPGDKVTLSEIGNAKMSVAIGRFYTRHELMLIRDTGLIIRPGGVKLMLAEQREDWYQQRIALFKSTLKTVDIYPASLEKIEPETPYYVAMAMTMTEELTLTIGGI